MIGPISMQSIRLILAALSLASLLSACGGGGHAASPPGNGLTVTPGDRQVTVSWKAESNVDYWLFFGPASSISTDNWTTISGSRVATNISSPYVVTGLTNGTTYSFTMNGRVNGGPGGSGTPSVSAVPLIAGSIWSLGGTLGSSEIRGISNYTDTSNLATYVAIGSSGAMYRSTDGVSWTASTAAGSTSLNAILYSLGKHIAVGASGSVLYSADATTWTASNAVTTANLNSIASNNAFVVAVGDNGTIRYSSDGATWSAAASVPSSANLYGVTYSAQGLWVAVGASGTLLTSSDGSNWNLIAAGTTADLKGVAVLAVTTNNVVTYTLAAAGTGGTLLTSKDGVSWSSQTLSPAVDLNAIVAWSQFVAVGAGGKIVSSIDGMTWANQNSGVTSNLLTVANAQGQYIAAGQGGVSVYSR